MKLTRIERDVLYEMVGFLMYWSAVEDNAKIHDIASTYISMLDTMLEESEEEELKEGG